MNARNPVLFRDFRDSLHDLSIGFGGRIILASRDFDRFSEQSVLSDDQVTRQSSGGE
jgi:hypothetical protein